MNRLRFLYVHIQLLMIVTVAAAKGSSITPTSSPAASWHSPVPYLFAGLAAMLGLIAFALLILACSYWNLSGYIHNNSDRDLEAGNGDGDSKTDDGYNMEASVLEDKYLVIMAGQVKPTFLATPIVSSTQLWFGSCSCQSNATFSKSMTGMETVEETGKQGSSDL